MNLNPNTPFFVVSFGGSGSKMLAKTLFDASARENEVKIENLHSHRRLPPTETTQQTRVIYIYSDPRNVVLSFFQRRERRHAAHNFYPNKQLDEPDREWAAKHLQNLEINAPPHFEDHNISSYLEEGIDTFRLDEHVDNWLLSNVPYPITFLRYEHLWDNIEAISAHLNVPKLSLPAQIKRSANWSNLDERNRYLINLMYGDLYEKLNKLPSVFYKLNGTTFDVFGNEINLNIQHIAQIKTI